MQSSSATSGLVIAFASQGLLNLESGLALILGANIGTCITAVLASIGGTLTARRTAIAHVLFNVIGVVVFLFLLTPFAKLVALTSNATARQLANAHTIFNITTTILLFPFIHHFVGLVQPDCSRYRRSFKQQTTVLKPKYYSLPSCDYGSVKEQLEWLRLLWTCLTKLSKHF